MKYYTIFNTFIKSASLLALVLASCTLPQEEAVLTIPGELRFSQTQYSGLQKTVDIHHKVPNMARLGYHSYFGTALAFGGDVDGKLWNSVVTLAVGDHSREIGNDRSTRFAGAVYLVSLLADGTIHNTKTILPSHPKIQPLAIDSSFFGWAVEFIPDPDGAGEYAAILAVGAPNHMSEFERAEFAQDNWNYNPRGALFLLYLYADGTIGKVIRFDHESEVGPLKKNAELGYSLAYMGDMDGEGGSDYVLAVGAANSGPRSVNSRVGTGELYLLYLNYDGTLVKKVHYDKNNPLLSYLTPSDQFGSAVANLGDLDGSLGESVRVLVVGSSGKKYYRNDEWNSAIDYAGEMALLWLLPDGTLTKVVRWTQGTHNIPKLTDSSSFGEAVASLGDIDGVGRGSDHVVASTAKGIVYLFSILADGTIVAVDTIDANTPHGAPVRKSAGGNSYAQSLVRVDGLDVPTPYSFVLAAGEPVGLGRNTGEEYDGGSVYMHYVRISETGY